MFCFLCALGRWSLSVHQSVQFEPILICCLLNGESPQSTSGKGRLWYTWYNYPQGPTFTAAAPRYLQAQHLQNPAAVALGVKGRSTKRLEDSQ